MKYPLQLYIIWATEPASSKENTCSTLAKSIFSTFHRDIENPVERGIGIPVYFIATATIANKELLSIIDKDTADKTLLIWLVTDTMIGNKSKGWQAALQQCIEQPFLDSIYVALTANFYKFYAPINQKQWILLFEEEQKDWTTVLCNKLAIALLSELQEEKASTSLFISHAQADSTDKVRLFKRMVRDFEEQIQVHTEAPQVGAGYTFDKKVERDIEQSVFIILNTKAYQEQNRCFRKLLFAKKVQCPIIVIQATKEFLPRWNPYLGNIPSIAWPEQQAAAISIEKQLYLEVLTPILLVALRQKYQEQYLKKYSNLENTAVFAMPPELLTLYQKQLPAKTRVLFPDPPLGSSETSLLEGYIQGALLTPALHPILEQRHSTEQGYKDLLAAVEEEDLLIGLSVSEIQQAVGQTYKGVSQWHVQDAMVELTRYLLACGASCAYAGAMHYQVGGINFMQILADLLKNYNKEQRTSASITNHQINSPSIGEDYNPSLWANYMDVVDFREENLTLFSLEDKPYSKEAKRAWVLSYTRRRIFDDYNEAQIFIGGKSKGYTGILPGIIEEAYWALYGEDASSLELPIYLLGGFGGMTRALAELLETGDSTKLQQALEARQQQEGWEDLYQAYQKLAQENTPLQAFASPCVAPVTYAELKLFFLRHRNTQDGNYLNNGLSREENEILFHSTNTLQISSLILKGLYNYFFK